MYEHEFKKKQPSNCKGKNASTTVPSTAAIPFISQKKKKKTQPSKIYHPFLIKNQ